MGRLRISLLALLLLSVCFLIGCGDSARDTPETTIASARKVVEQGRADKLGQFIYADSKDMRRLLIRYGGFLGNVQKLGDAVRVLSDGGLVVQLDPARRAGSSWTT